jgi:hypothetical protein
VDNQYFQVDSDNITIWVLHLNHFQVISQGLLAKSVVNPIIEPWIVTIELMDHTYQGRHLPAQLAMVAQTSVAQDNDEP